MWHDPQIRGSARSPRSAVTRFEPPGLSTVKTSTGHPVASTRRSTAASTSQFPVAYSWNETGSPRALTTSSMVVDATLESTNRCWRAAAARATASSPSEWKARWLPTGARRTGVGHSFPKSVTPVSTDSTPTSRRGRM